MYHNIYCITGLDVPYSALQAGGKPSRRRRSRQRRRRHNSLPSDLAAGDADFRPSWENDVYGNLLLEEAFRSQSIPNVASSAYSMDPILGQGWKFMSCSHCQELGQQASWLLTGYTRVNNQSEAKIVS